MPGLCGSFKSSRRSHGGEEENNNKPTRHCRGPKVLAVQFNRRELDVLREALESHQARGSRVTVSQLIRWAVNNIDFDQMPEVP